jgi:hypothetical protein
MAMAKRKKNERSNRELSVMLEDLRADMAELLTKARKLVRHTPEEKARWLEDIERSLDGSRNSMAASVDSFDEAAEREYAEDTR